VLTGALLTEVSDLRDIPVLSNWAPEIVMMSPFAVILSMFGEMISPHFPTDTSTAPFYLFHYVLMAIALVIIHRRNGKLRATYLTPPTSMPMHAPSDSTLAAQA
jgi:hypothetical protein